MFNFISFNYKVLQVSSGLDGAAVAEENDEHHHHLKWLTDLGLLLISKIFEFTDKSNAPTSNLETTTSEVATDATTTTTATTQQGLDYGGFVVPNDLGMPPVWESND